MDAPPLLIVAVGCLAAAIPLERVGQRHAGQAAVRRHHERAAAVAAVVAIGCFVTLRAHA